MEDTSIEILTILRFYFKLALKAAEGTYRMLKDKWNETFGHPALNRFVRFSEGGTFPEKKAINCQWR